MAQVKLLLIDSDGLPVEHTQDDEVTFASFTVSGGAQVLAATGLTMGDTDIVGVQDLSFTTPSANTINQTAGNLIIDDIMAKERQNVMTTAGEILFPVVTNTAGQLDNFQVPQVAGAPTATPTNSGEGFMVWDSSGNDLYIWDGAAWDSQSIVEDANRVKNTYLAGEAIAIVDALYISAASTVSLASATAATQSRLIGFAAASAASGASVGVVSEGVLPGFSGLTPASRYYLDDAPGTISTSVPTGTGKTIVQCGYARSASELHVQIQELGRRS
jgi:hypothetical protein